MKAKEVHFENDRGLRLTGMVELPPAEKPRRFAIFAHCFTCNKDLRSVRKIALALTQRGFGGLRFDFAGLGNSAGDFSETNFSSIVEDLQAAYAYVEAHHQTPDLLIGHSLGGASVLMAAGELPGISAVATIGAPCEPDHVLKLMAEDLASIKALGEATVTLTRRKFKIKKQFIEDLETYGMKGALEKLKGRPLFFMHSPQDDTVGIENARYLYTHAQHPKSFISLDGADHLLTKGSDAAYAGEVMAAWASRYLPEKQDTDALQTEEQVVAELEEGPFLIRLRAGRHHLLADEPHRVGGEDLGPSPYEYLASGLGACTAMTLKIYPRRKECLLEEVQVLLSWDGKYQVRGKQCAHCDEPKRKIGRFIGKIRIEGELDEKQRQRLLQITNKCPVHKTLERSVHIHSKLTA